MSKYDLDFEGVPLEQHPPFRDWASFVKLRAETGRLHEGRAMEASKLSAEYGKIIVTNLHLINGGALLAVPTLSESLFGFKNLDRWGKLFYLGLPMGLFSTGLILASLCAFFAYCNWSAAARGYDLERRIAEFSIERINPLLGPDQPARTKTNIEECKSLKNKSDSSLMRNYWCSLAAGWASMIVFIGSCAFLAVNIK